MLSSMSKPVCTIWWIMTNAIGIWMAILPLKKETIGQCYKLLNVHVVYV